MLLYFSQKLSDYFNTVVMVFLLWFISFIVRIRKYCTWQEHYVLDIVYKNYQFKYQTISP